MHAYAMGRILTQSRTICCRACRLSGTQSLSSTSSHVQASKPLDTSSFVRHFSSLNHNASTIRTRTLLTTDNLYGAFYQQLQQRRGFAQILYKPTENESLSSAPPPFLDVGAQEQQQQQQQQQPGTSTIDNLSTTSIQDDSETINITEAAEKRIRAIKEKENNPNKALRVAVEAGGCHGYQYKLEVTDLSERDPAEDYVFSTTGDDPAVIIDATSYSMVKGCTLNYATELIGSSFRIEENPQAKGSGCGCGVSWELKDQ